MRDHKKKMPGSTTRAHDTDGRTKTASNQSITRGEELAARGKALQEAHLQKHPRSPHALMCEDWLDLTNATKARPDAALIDYTAAGYDYGFYKGYMAAQLEARAKKKKTGAAGSCGKKERAKHDRGGPAIH